MNDIRRGFKILLHDWSPPVQGGAPLLVCPPVGPVSFPVVLPPVFLDTSSKNCGAGYNYCGTLAAAAKIAGFWRTGRPAKCLAVTASSDAIERSSKRRASSLILERLCTDEEIKEAMSELVSPWAGSYATHLAWEQWLWYTALGRPEHDEKLVVAGLEAALQHRGLTSWRLKRFANARDARDARDAWTARDAWAAWDARDAWAARAAWAAWAARAAWDARDALTMNTAVGCGWLSSYSADHLTFGIRTAYTSGLELAIPTGKYELGYAMAPTKGGL